MVIITFRLVVNGVDTRIKAGRDVMSVVSDRSFAVDFI